MFVPFMAPRLSLSFVELWCSRRFSATMVPTKAATISSTTWKSVFRDTMTCWAPLMHVNFDPDDCGFSPFSPSILIAASRGPCRDCATRRDDDGQLGQTFGSPRLPTGFSPQASAREVVARDLSAAHAARKAP